MIDIGCGSGTTVLELARRVGPSGYVLGADISQRGGRLTFAVFRTPQENPWGTAPVGAVRHLLPPIKPPGPEEPGQFSWADPARVRRILEGAGFEDISLTRHDPAMRLLDRGVRPKRLTLQ